MRRSSVNRLLAYLFLTTSCTAATPLFRTSFEIKEQNWTAVHGTATPDAAILHNGNKALRVEASPAGDACIQLAPVSLTIGKRYEVSAWARTDHLDVRDLDRSPIAIGATLTMASMP